MNVWEKSVEVVETCLKGGIVEFVVCGGARNAALVEALARAEAAGKVRLWRHFEERSAGFFALGRTMDTGKPCAVVTTSGTAVAELLPAVIEAHYQNRPVVALTADRPDRFRGTGAPQSMDQTGIFGAHAVSGSPAEWDGRGPLHWNVELEEEFVPGTDRFAEIEEGEFSPEKDRLDVAGLARWLREDAFRGLVVLIGGLETTDREEVYHFCKALGAPLVAEAASGLREALPKLMLHDADRVLRANPPGKVLRLGEVPSGRFWRDLEDLPDVSVWSVCRNGLPGLARECGTIRGEVARVLQGLGEVDEVEDALDYLPDSPGKAAMIDELLYAYPDSEPAMVATLSQFASAGNGVFLGNSLPIREWNLFAQRARPVPDVRANRGVNGIDGQVSTWLGWSADVADSWAVLGDLTTMYDTAAGFLSGQVEMKGRVLAIINNGGGRIFERLPRLEAMAPKAAECLTNPHKQGFRWLADLFEGSVHREIRTSDDWDSFDPDSERLTLLEIIPDEAETKRFWLAWDAMAAR